jgi:hypothetical protein
MQHTIHLRIPHPLSQDAWRDETWYFGNNDKLNKKHACLKARTVAWRGKTAMVAVYWGTIGFPGARGTYPADVATPESSLQASITPLVRTLVQYEK